MWWLLAKHMIKCDLVFEYYHQSKFNNSYKLICFAIDFYRVRKRLGWGLFWYMILVFYRIISWRKIHNLVRSRTKNLFHQDIGANFFFSLNITYQSKIVVAWLIFITLYPYYLHYYYEIDQNLDVLPCHVTR